MYLSLSLNRSLISVRSIVFLDLALTNDCQSAVFNSLGCEIMTVCFLSFNAEEEAVLTDLSAV